MDNILYYGDNLDVLRQHIDSESVDLVYLDPPFKSNQNCNILFKEQDGSRAASQILSIEYTMKINKLIILGSHDLLCEGM